MAASLTNSPTTKRRPAAWAVIVSFSLTGSLALMGVAGFLAAGSDRAVALPPEVYHSPSATPSPSASPTPSPTLPAIEAVAPAAPTRIKIPDLSVDAPVEGLTLELVEQTTSPRTGQSCVVDGQIICINPPAFDVVYWQIAGVGGLSFGDMPGSDSPGNIYLMGHSSHKVDAVFTNLYQLTPGQSIEITTANGRLTYQVAEVLRIDKDAYSTLPQANEQVPGRLLLITCYYGPDAEFEGNSAAANFVVVADLKEAKAVG